jgi:sec-independent protein translocase protein TatC
VRPDRRKGNPRREMTFLEHLDELRIRLIICLVGIVFTTIISGIWLAGPMLDMLTAPFLRAETRPKTENVLTLRFKSDGSLHALNVQDFKDGKLSKEWIKIEAPGEGNQILIGPGGQGGLVALTLFAPIMLYIKASIILGIVFAMPLWLYQLWLFVAPAMTTTERRLVRPVVQAGVFLFPLGAASAYGLMNLIMPILIEYAKMISGVQLMPDIQKYVSFALNLMLALGLVFETPLALLIAVRMRLVSTETLRKSRSYVVVGIFILAAILTPTTDPFTLLAMAFPMLALFEISLWLARAVERKVEAADRAAAESA